MPLREVKKISHFSLSDQIYSLLKDAILKGELAPGERLEEDKLAKLFQVSRSPVREAIRKLEHTGLVTIVPRRGAFVVRLSYKEIIDIMDIREVLEGLAARLACENLSEKDLTKIEKFFHKLEQEVKKGNITEYPQQEFDFHKFILRFANNDKLTVINNALYTQIRFIRYRSGASSKKRVVQAIKEHKALLEAFKKRDPVLAEKRMRQHIRNAKANILRIMTSKD